MRHGARALVGLLCVIGLAGCGAEEARTDTDRIANALRASPDGALQAAMPYLADVVELRHQPQKIATDGPVTKDRLARFAMPSPGLALAVIDLKTIDTVTAMAGSIAIERQITGTLKDGTPVAEVLTHRLVVADGRIVAWEIVNSSGTRRLINGALPEESNTFCSISSPKAACGD